MSHQGESQLGWQRQPLQGHTGGIGFQLETRGGLLSHILTTDEAQHSPLSPGSSTAEGHTHPSRGNRDSFPPCRTERGHVREASALND